ncbi:MAG TPA: c-type cytochrome [Myxococcaceae bacterium]|nr:c-type cytochrome [Myxococcaceae bacterium]
MRRTLEIVGLVLAAVVILAGGSLLYVQLDGIPRYPVEKVTFRADPTPERIARGKKLATLLCANCHLDPTTRQLTGKFMVDAPAEFGVIYSPNITRHPSKGIGSWTDGELAYLLRTGVKRDGLYAPPWMVKLPHIADEDLASIIAFLRSDDPMVAASDRDPPGVTRPSFLTKLLCHLAFRKLPYPDHPISAPPLTDRVAHGRYLVFALDCYGCHSADFKTMNVAEPERSAGYFGGGNPVLDLQRQTIRSANLTPDTQTGIGRWSEADFVTALRTGFRPDRTLIRYPMSPLPELSDEEAADIHAYLRTVPAIRNPVLRPPPPFPSSARTADGKRLYEQYGCVSCHGKDGVGIADLRRAGENYPTRESLKLWIQEAPRIKPGTRMPAWNGVIREQDYEPLIDHVLELGKTRS